MSTQGSDLSRRMFIGTALATGALAANCGKSQPAMVSSPKLSGVTIPVLHDTAPDGPVLKAGLVGCGGRGTGAAIQYLNAGPNLQLVAMGDVFQDRIDGSHKKINEATQATVPEGQRFVGFDAYRKVIDSGVDVVLIATPPHFRPEHFKAAVAADKHVFMEKPLAVDPVGAKSIIETAGQAKTKNLSVVTGTQRHHQKPYVETLKRIAGGEIGEIVGARCYWNQSQLWYRERKPGWSDMEWMIRDWVNWTWLSGDHIVEQHVHNIDVINWFTGKLPVKAVGFGGRARRVTGDQYDFFSIDFEYEDGMHTQSMCRQVNGCANNVSEFVVGTKGSSNCANTIYNHDGSIRWKFPEEDTTNPFDQEHIDFVTSIRTSEPLNEARLTAESTLCAIMGRISAYTGKETTWKEMLDSDMRIGPEEYAMGSLDTNAVIAVPGAEKV